MNHIIGNNGLQWDVNYSKLKQPVNQAFRTICKAYINIGHAEGLNSRPRPHQSVVAIVAKHYNNRLQNRQNCASCVDLTNNLIRHYTCNNNRELRKLRKLNILTSQKQTDKHNKRSNSALKYFQKSNMSN